MAPAERADMIVDFSNVPIGNHVLRNVGPDEPFGGGEPPGDFDEADPYTTGQVLQFRVVPALVADPTTPPQFLVLPPLTPLPTATVTRRLALLEEMSSSFEGAPAEALLGTVSGDPALSPAQSEALGWSKPVTENPSLGATEVWEFYNMTGDAHPIHVHEIAFEVINRQDILIDEETGQVRLASSDPRPPETWETGLKDTVIAYPGQVTRIGPEQPGQPMTHTMPSPLKRAGR